MKLLRKYVGSCQSEITISHCLLVVSYCIDIKHVGRRWSGTARSHCSPSWLCCLGPHLPLLLTHHYPKPCLLQPMIILSQNSFQNTKPSFLAHGSSVSAPRVFSNPPSSQFNDGFSPKMKICVFAVISDRTNQQQVVVSHLLEILPLKYFSIGYSLLRPAWDQLYFGK